MTNKSLRCIFFIFLFILAFFSVHAQTDLTNDETTINDERALTKITAQNEDSEESEDQPFLFTYSGHGNENGSLVFTDGEMINFDDFTG